MQTGVFRTSSLPKGRISDDLTTVEFQLKSERGELLKIEIPATRIGDYAQIFTVTAGELSKYKNNGRPVPLEHFQELQVYTLQCTGIGISSSRYPSMGLLIVRNYDFDLGFLIGAQHVRSLISNAPTIADHLETSSGSVLVPTVEDTDTVNRKDKAESRKDQIFSIIHSYIPRKPKTIRSVYLQHLYTRIQPALTSLLAGDNALSEFSLNVAVEHFRKFKHEVEVFSDLHEEATKEHPELHDDPQYENIAECFKFIRICHMLSDFLIEYCSGSYYHMCRNPGLASEHYRAAGEAARKLRKVEPKAEIDHGIVLLEANQTLAKAEEQLFQGNLINVMSLCQDGLHTLENHLKDNSKVALVGNENIINEYQICKSLMLVNLHNASARDNLFKEQFENSKRALDKLISEYENCILSSDNQNPSINEAMFRSEYEMHKGFQSLVQGEVWRTQQQWDKAIECFEDTRKAWIDAANHISGSEHPLAQAIQYQFLNLASTLVPVYQNRCKGEMLLHHKIRELEEFRNDLLLAAQIPNINITNRNEILQEINHNVTIVHEIEENFRDNLRKHKAELSRDDIPQEIREKINETIEDVLNENSHGIAFFKKLRRLSGEIASIVKNMQSSGESISKLMDWLRDLPI